MTMLQVDCTSVRVSRTTAGGLSSCQFLQAINAMNSESNSVPKNRNHKTLDHKHSLDLFVSLLSVVLRMLVASWGSTQRRVAAE